MTTDRREGVKVAERSLQPQEPHACDSIRGRVWQEAVTVRTFLGPLPMQHWCWQAGDGPRYVAASHAEAIHMCSVMVHLARAEATGASDPA